LSETHVEARPWYAEGLRFSCVRGCRRCCGGFPGHVWVTEQEIRALATCLNMTPADFWQDYVRRVGNRLSLRERTNYDCVLLGPNGCVAYPARPQQCRDYPFWPEVVNSREAWEDEAQRCPGMNEGRTYCAGEIDELLNNQKP